MTPKSLTAAVAALTLAVTTLTAEAQEVVLRYSNWVPTTHPIITDVIEPLKDDLEAATDGRVTIEVMPALGPPAGHFDLVANGVADMAFTVHSYSPGRFTLTELGELPFGHDNVEVHSLAYWKTYNRYLAAANEHDGVRLLGLWTNGPSQLALRGALLSAPDAVEGRRVRVPGALLDKVTAKLGMVSISAPITDAYEQISRGVIDGMYTQLQSMKDFELTEFLTHVSMVPGGFAQSSQMVILSDAAYQRMSEPDRAAFDALMGEALVRRFARMWQSNAEAAEAYLKEAGTTLYKVPDETLLQLRSDLASLESDWIAAAQERGVDGAAALAFFRSEIDKIAAGMEP